MPKPKEPTTTAKAHDLIKKTINIVLLIFSTVLLAFALKLTYEVAYSPLQAAVQHPDRLTIFYRPGCGRCHKALPRMIPRLLFSTKRDYLINADELSQAQLRKARLKLTPGFMYDGKTVQTIDSQRIDQIWKQSH